MKIIVKNYGICLILIKITSWIDFQLQAAAYFIINQTLPKIPDEVDLITGLTAGSGNFTQDLLTLPEAVPQEINGSLDRIAELPKI